MTHMKVCARDHRDRKSRRVTIFTADRKYGPMASADLDKSISRINCSALFLAAPKSPREFYPVPPFYLLYFKEELNGL